MKPTLKRPRATAIATAAYAALVALAIAGLVAAPSPTAMSLDQAREHLALGHNPDDPPPTVPDIDTQLDNFAAEPPAPVPDSDNVAATPEGIRMGNADIFPDAGPQADAARRAVQASPPAGCDAWHTDDTQVLAHTPENTIVLVFARCARLVKPPASDMVTVGKAGDEQSTIPDVLIADQHIYTVALGPSGEPSAITDTTPQQPGDNK